MANKAGVWIDHKQAIVVLVTDAGQEIKRIAFDIGQAVPSKVGSRSKGSHTPHDFVAENTRERKVENDRKDYFNDVIAAIRGADSLLILGPGEAKSELSKHIKAKKLRGVGVELETADKMTDRQLTATVREHFAKTPAGKVAPKKTAKSKAANDTSAKRTTKSGK